MMKATLSALAITALCATCAPSASTSEIPHPPFTADRFQEFETHPLLECLNEETRKAKMMDNRLRQENRPDFLMGAIEVYNRESEFLFRQLNDCYIVAQLKWGVTQPVSYDRFSQMRDVIRKRCDAPYEERDLAWKRAHPASERLTEAQKTVALNEWLAAFKKYAADWDQCYRDVQTEWGFK
jgi:hypothetical protein